MPTRTGCRLRRPIYRRAISETLCINMLKGINGCYHANRRATVGTKNAAVGELAKNDTSGKRPLLRPVTHDFQILCS